jgi:hypothetical protein
LLSSGEPKDMEQPAPPAEAAAVLPEHEESAAAEPAATLTPVKPDENRDQEAPTS